MIIVETCPKCGHDLTDVIVATYPPIPKKECWNCGWSWEGAREEIVRVPFGGNSLDPEWQRNYLGKWNISDPLDDFNNTLTKGNFENNSCANCSSNPKNGGDGICFCTLGQQAIY